MRYAFCGYNFILLLLQVAEKKVHFGGEILHDNTKECDVQDEVDYIFEKEQCIGEVGYSLRLG